MNRHRTQSWSYPPVNVVSIFEKHEETFSRNINILLLLPYITLLSWDEVNQLEDKAHSAPNGNEKTTKLLQYLTPHGEKGLRELISALKKTQYHQHICLAKKLEWELTAIPEERANTKQQQRMMYKMSNQLLLSTKESLRTQGNQIVELLKTHVQLELQQDHKCKHEITKAQTTDEVIDTLTEHDHISHRDMSLLVQIVGQFCEPLQNQVTQLETLRGLEELKHDVISELAPLVPLYLLKFCSTCTPLPCGASDYYRSIAHLHDTASVIRRVYSSTDPRLFLRIVLQFSKHVPTKERVQAYSIAVKTQISPNSAEDELLKLQEQYSSIITELIDKVDQYDNPITDTLYSQYRYHGIPLWTENTGHLPILPFFNYQCQILLINAMNCARRHMRTYNKHQLRENIAETLTKLVSYETEWRQYSQLTKVATVSETMLNEYPIDFAQEDLVVIVVHLNGEQWKAPTLSQYVELAKPISEAFNLPLGSVTPLRPILTHNETDAKGHCKVELAASTKATCVIIRQLLSKVLFLMDQSITHVELKATGKYHFNHPTQALNILQKQAFQNKHLRTHFQELHSAILPHAIQQSSERWRVWCMYVVIIFIVLAATTYQHI